MPTLTQQIYKCALKLLPIFVVFRLIYRAENISNKKNRASFYVLREGLILWKKYTTKFYACVWHG